MSTPTPTPTLTLADLSVPAPPPGPADWNPAGVVIHRGLLDPGLVAAYLEEWAAHNGPLDTSYDPHGRPYFTRPPASPGGWADCTPYMRHPALARLVCDPAIAAILAGLIGEPAGVHLNLTGLVSTQRDWHIDSYLNPPHVGDYYAAVWYCLADVHPDSGPFQYVPGSHRWPVVTRDLIGAHLDMSDPAWPTRSEAILTPIYTAEIATRRAEVVTYLPAAGDVLVWHGRLVHRGSRPRIPGTYRGGLIAHYSGLTHRSDMPPARQHAAGGWYFPIEHSGPVR